MAQGIHLEPENFCCSICLDLLKDPVTVPCGHSYCMSCIKEYFNKEDYRSLYRCPQCRATFTPRPALVKNNMLAFVVEELKRSPAVPDDHSCAGPEDVHCDVCTGIKPKAFKSCLQTSYCENHLHPSYDGAPLKRHKLVEPSVKFQVGLIRQKIQQRIQDKENDVKMFQQQEDCINESADNALKHTDVIFRELIHVIEERVSDIKEKIQSQQTTELGRFGKVRGKVEQEIAKLRRKDTQLEKLSQADDLINDLSLSHMDIYKDPPSVEVGHVQSIEEVTVALLEAREKLLAVLDEEYAKITVTLPETCVGPSNLQAEPRTRADFLQYASQITLDLNTSNTHLSISNEKRRATFTSEEQKYCFRPERFAHSWQVLSEECLTGKCYWEVERSGRGVLLALAYKDISRDGNFTECVFGNNEKSWALDCYKNSYEFRHNNLKTPIAGTWSSRVGVYLDHRAGILSFYSVSETMTLLHRVQTTFTQPLYAGLWLSDGATAEFSKLK